MPSSNGSDRGIWNTFGFLTKVKYGGALGKVAAVGIVFLLLLGVVAFAAQGVAAILWGVLVIALAGLIFVISKMQTIFQSNPEMATLEGKEVIQYRQLEEKSKHHEPFRVIEIAPDPKLGQQTPSVLADQQIGSEDNE